MVVWVGKRLGEREKKKRDVESRDKSLVSDMRGRDDPLRLNRKGHLRVGAEGMCTSAVQ